MTVLIGLAWAASALVVAPDTPRPGVPTEVQLAVWEDDGPVERIEAVDVSQGDLLAVTAVEPGLWSISWVPAREGSATFAVAGARAETQVAGPLTSSLEPLGRASGQVGQTVVLRFRGADLPELADVQVAAPEGQVLGIERTAEELRVSWRSDGDLRPRVVPVGVRDARRPGAPPSWVQVRLSVSIPVTVRTEPGAKMVMEVGGRSYGPVIAGEDGVAAVRVDLNPGETSGQAVLTDALGNTRRSKVTLAPEARPSVAGLVEGSLLPGAHPPPIHLLALNAAGGPWAGDAPTCESVQGSLDVRRQSKGRYVATLPPGASGDLLDLRVDCRLPRDLARTSVIVGVEQGLPSRLVLRVWPEELSADFPVAQVQAWVEDSRGDRLPPDGLILRGEHGLMQDVVRDGLVLRTDFHGNVQHPEDRVHAEWWLPPGEGEPRAVQLRSAVDSGLLQVSARAVDRAGRPLVGVPILLELAGESVEVVSDEEGWVLGVFQAPTVPSRVTARCMGRQAEGVFLPWSATALVAPGPDLSQVVPVRIRAGSIRKVSLGVDRPVLLTGGGDTAVITVLLLDAAGQPVTDEAVTVSASEGFVSTPKVQLDGALFAIYQPPARMRTGTVEVTVSALDGSFPDTSVTIELMPEPVLRAPSLHAGVISNFVGLTTLTLGTEIEQVLPLFSQHTNLRLGVDWYRDSRSIALEQTKAELRMTLVPVTVGIHRRWSKGLRGSWAGAGLVLTPYRIQAWYDGAQALDAVSLHRPGVSVYAGQGYRIRAGELYVEARYLAVGSRSEQYEGQLGGLVLVGGVRIVY